MKATMSTTNTPLNKAGLSIEVKNGNVKVGELTVSQGGIQWLPTRGRNKGPQHRFIRWSRLDAALGDKK
jgi:hypothetical protein